MGSNRKPEEIIAKMMAQDAFSQWLGIQIDETGVGYCRLSMRIRPEMCNGFSIAHGGITFSLADSALAFASNSRGRHALSIDTSIAHVKPLHPGEMITAHTKEIHISNKIAIYHVYVTNEADEQVAVFKGTVYRKGTDW